MITSTVSPAAEITDENNGTTAKASAFTSRILAWKSIAVSELHKHEFRTPNGLLALSVACDPTEENPFQIEFYNCSVERAATVAFGILTVLRAACPPPQHTDESFDHVLKYLEARANMGLLPF